MLNTERRIAALEASARDDNMKTEKKPENIKARRVRVFFWLVLVATRYKIRYWWLHSGYTEQKQRRKQKTPLSFK